MVAKGVLARCNGGKVCLGCINTLIWWQGVSGVSWR